MKAYGKAYREANADKVKKANKQDYQNNIDKYKEQNKKYRKSHK